MNIVNIKNTMEHFDSLAEYHQNEWAHLTEDETLTERKIRMQEYLCEDFIPSIFLAKDKELYGSAAIVKCDMSTKPHLSPWLASVFVLPLHRGKGIGKLLVEHIMHKAKENGISKMYLYTETAEGLYAKLGWTTISREVYNDEPVIIMELDLLRK